MADRMRVTSVIGATGRAKASAEQPLPNPLSGVRVLCLADASYLLTRQLLTAAEEAMDECTTRLAPSPGLLRHAAGHRAVAGPTVRRRRTAAHPPVRPAHRPDPGLS